MSPAAYRKICKTEREAWAAYEAARSKALEAGRAYRAARSGRLMLAREDALGSALEARRWAWGCTRYRLAKEAEGIAKGERMSPAARARAIASGRLHP